MRSLAVERERTYARTNAGVSLNYTRSASFPHPLSSCSQLFISLIFTLHCILSISVLIIYFCTIPNIRGVVDWRSGKIPDLSHGYRRSCRGFEKSVCTACVWALVCT